MSINHASAQMADCQTTLSLASYPRTGTVGSTGILPVNLVGEMKCGDSDIGGATVIITGIDESSNDVITSEYGKYSLQVRLCPGEYEIQAYFAGDATHISATATKTLKVDELSQGYLLSFFSFKDSRLTPSVIGRSFLNMISTPYFV